MQKSKHVEVPPELKSKCNNVKRRILFLPPSVVSGDERECRRDDFESLSNNNIGVGGFGKVYKVRHKVSKNVYAIKVINKAKIIEHDLVEQIKLEVEIMYKLDHKHVVKLHNHYEDDDSFYLILEFAPKG
jgi:serine/threonine protein kinase